MGKPHARPAPGDVPCADERAPVTQLHRLMERGGLAGGHGVVEFLLVEVDQGQLGALGGEVLAHGPAQALTAAGDDDDFVFEFHNTTPQMV